MRKVLFSIAGILLMCTSFSFAQCVPGATSCNDVIIPDIGVQKQQDSFDIVFTQIGQYADQLVAKNSKQSDLNNLADKIDLLVKKLSDVSLRLRNGNVQTQPTNSCQKISQTLWEGNVNQNSSDVLLLQNFILNEAKVNGYLKDGDKDGVYGSYTNYYVKEFQKRHGISATGAVGPKTLAKINSMICNIGSTSSCNQGLACPAIAINCQTGYHKVAAVPKYDSNGCQTNICDQGQCVPDSNNIISTVPTNSCVNYVNDNSFTDNNFYHDKPTYYSEGQTYISECGPSTVPHTGNIVPGGCGTGPHFIGDPVYSKVATCHNGQWSITTQITQ